MTLQATNRRQSREGGSTMVEAALSLTVFLMVLFGIVDLGRMIWSFNLVAHGAREGIRYAIVHGNTSSTPASVTDIASYLANQTLGLATNSTTVTVTWTPDNSPGSTVNVEVRYSYDPIAPYIPPGTWTLRARSQGIIAR